MKWSAILESIATAEFKSAPDDLELYRKDVLIRPGSGGEQLRLSILDVAPEYPEHVLVLVHGFAASNAWWYTQMLPLARRSRVIAPDLRGHGRSEHAPEGYTILQMADDLAALLDELGVTQPVVLAAHSAGGFVITEFALRYPQRVDRLVLIATPVEMKQSSLPILARLAMNLPDFIYPLAQPLSKRYLKGRGVSYLLGLHRFYQDMVRWRGEERFQSLTHPCMLIHGERDYIFTVSAYARVAELIPQAEVVNIGVSKHQVPLERPKALQRAIARFISSEQGTPDFTPDWRGENDAINSVRLVAERPWVVHYEQGTPLSLELPHVTLFRLLEYTAQAYPDRTAIRFRSQNLNYRQLLIEAERFAGILSALGLRKGDRVLLLLPNWPHFVVVFYGALRLGVVVVLGNPESSRDHIIEHARLTHPVLVVTTDAHPSLVQTFRQEGGTRHFLLAKETDYDLSKARQEEKEARKRGEKLVFELPQGEALELEWSKHLGAHYFDQAAPAISSPGVSPYDAAVISFTSGVSSGSKAVYLTHYNLVANALQLSAWFSPLTGKMTVLCGLPFAELFGLTVGISLVVRMGGCMILEPSHQVEMLLQAIQAHEPAVFVSIPHIFQALIDTPGLGQRFGRKVEYCLSGTSPLPVEVGEAFERLTHSRVIESYGLGETTQMTHINPLKAARTGSIGLPLPGTEADVVNLLSGKALPFGQIGELVVRGPQVTSLTRQGTSGPSEPDQTQGWLHTGDVARMDDDGFFFILGPISEMWTAEDGAPVFLRDVEEVIYEIPGVSEAAVVPVNNDPVAFIGLEAGAELTLEALQEFCRRRLPPSHIPRRVFFVASLPRNPQGKILRSELFNQANGLVKLS